MGVSVQGCRRFTVCALHRPGGCVGGGARCRSGRGHRAGNRSGVAQAEETGAGEGLASVDSPTAPSAPDTGDSGCCADASGGF